MIFTVELWDDARLWLLPSRSLSPEDYKAWKDKCSGFEERDFRISKTNGERGYVVPMTQPTIDYLNATWQRDVDYTFSDQVKILYAYHKVSNKVDLTKSVKRWNYLFNGEPTDFTYPHTRTPFPQQAVALEACLGREFFGLLMEPGTGKTKVITDEIGLDSLDLKHDEMQRYVVVCPRSIRINWYRELRINIPDFHNVGIRILNGTQDANAEAIWELTRESCRQKLVIVSFDSLRGLLPLLLAWGPSYLAIDESHYAKSARSKRWKSLKSLSNYAERRRILTGSPVANTILDLWAQFELLQPGCLGYATFAGFKSKFCNVVSIIDPHTNKPTTFDKIVGYKHVEELKERMARCSLTVRKEHCLKFLPKKLYETRHIEMPAAVRLQYQELLKNFTLALDEETEVSTEFVLVQMTRLAQICCGFVGATKIKMSPVSVDDEGNVCEDEEVIKVIVPIEGGDAKLNEMIEDAEEVVKASKLIIWARFSYDCDAIMRLLTAKGIGCVLYDGRDSNEKRRQQRIDSFNEDSACRVFVSKTASGGVGLTLLGNQAVDEDRCKTVFFYSNSYNMAQRVQAEDRAHRIGQHSPVLYRDYVYEGTIEEDIADALQNKRDVANEMKNLSTIKSILLQKTQQ